MKTAQLSLFPRKFGKFPSIYISPMTTYIMDTLESVRKIKTSNNNSLGTSSPTVSKIKDSNIPIPPGADGTNNPIVQAKENVNSQWEVSI